jgi:hypothetical protein
MELEDFLYDFCSDYELDYDIVFRKYLKGVKVRSSCTALTKRGEMCKKTCNFGTNRCYVHGGEVCSEHVFRVEMTLEQVIDRISHDYRIDRFQMRKRYFYKIFDAVPEPVVEKRNELDCDRLDAEEAWLEMELA